jgi:hypothetical protein
MPPHGKRRSLVPSPQYVPSNKYNGVPFSAVFGWGAPSIVMVKLLATALRLLLKQNTFV